jgi:hypothetical protein
LAGSVEAAAEQGGLFKNMDVGTGHFTVADEKSGGGHRSDSAPDEVGVSGVGRIAGSIQRGAKSRELTWDKLLSAA